MALRPAAPGARRMSAGNAGASCVVSGCTRRGERRGFYCTYHRAVYGAVNEPITTGDPAPPDVKWQPVDPSKNVPLPAIVPPSRRFTISSSTPSTSATETKTMSSPTGRLSKYHSPIQNQKKTNDMVNKTAAATLSRFLNAIRDINYHTDPYSAAASITDATCFILGCERASLFFVDDDAGELVLAGHVTSPKNGKPVRIPFGVSVAGFVVQNGETINIPDALTDKRVDQSAGHPVKATLATAVTDYNGEIVAVLQAFNPVQAAAFSADDVTLIENLALHVGVVLRNVQLYQQAVRNERKVSSLLEIVKSLHSDPAIQSVVFTLTHRAHTLCEADLCTLYMVDHAHQQLVVMQGELNIRFPVSKGIAGHVATSGATLNIADAYDDPRFNRDVDLKTGYRTKAILCMPIFNPDNEVMAVLQLINKVDGGKFTPDDEEIMTTLLRITGPIMAQSKLFLSKKKPAEAPSDIEPSSVSRSTTHSSIMESIQEEDHDGPDGALSPKLHHESSDPHADATDAPDDSDAPPDTPKGSPSTTGVPTPLSPSPPSTSSLG